MSDRVLGKAQRAALYGVRHVGPNSAAAQRPAWQRARQATPWLNLILRTPMQADLGFPDPWDVGTCERARKCKRAWRPAVPGLRRWLGGVSGKLGNVLGAASWSASQPHAAGVKAAQRPARQRARQATPWLNLILRTPMQADLGFPDPWDVGTCERARKCKRAWRPAVPGLRRWLGGVSGKLSNVLGAASWSTSQPHAAGVKAAQRPARHALGWRIRAPAGAAPQARWWG